MRHHDLCGMLFIVAGGREAKTPQYRTKGLSFHFSCSASCLQACSLPIVFHKQEFRFAMQSCSVSGAGTDRCLCPFVDRKGFRVTLVSLFDGPWAVKLMVGAYNLNLLRMNIAGIIFRLASAVAFALIP